MRRRTWLLLAFIAAALTIVGTASAQPPALQPRIDTHPQWNDVPSRSLTLTADGKASFPLEAGSRVFVSGGAFACQPDTVYSYTLALEASGPTWGKATLEPADLATVRFAVPAGPYQNGYPGPTTWFFQEGPSLVIDWFDMVNAPTNATFEYRVVGQGQATPVSGGCQPDPLGQPTRHIAETMNVTKPYVPPPPPTTTASDVCIGDCVTIAPIEPAKNSPMSGVGAVAFGAAVAVAARRPK